MLLKIGNLLFMMPWLVAAAVEYADRAILRTSSIWNRKIFLQIPVHDIARWNDSEVHNSLITALNFLTGDQWDIEFVNRSSNGKSPSGAYLNLSTETKAILAYSEGLDSLAVAGIIKSEIGDALQRVRVSKGRSCTKIGKHEAFTRVPYNVDTTMIKPREASARNRGFKFAMISSIAAYLSKAKEIIIPESGQGAIGPAIINVGRIYPDYRNHPRFTKLMEKFVNALFKTEIHFIFPRLWNTKGETLREYFNTTNSDEWRRTKSCWKGNIWNSVNGKYRQCGICAACMLRRLSLYTAGQEEDPETYICSNINAPTLEKAVDPNYLKKLNKSFEEYAIAGVLHLDHFAELTLDDSATNIKRHARNLAPAIGLSEYDAENKLRLLTSKHADEWKNFLNSLSKNSFIHQWGQFK